MRANCGGMLAKCSRLLTKPIDWGVRIQAHMRCVSNSSVCRQDQYADSQPLEASTESSIGINPLDHDDYFGVKKLVTLEELFRYRCHFGHDERCRNQYMTPYLFGNRSGIDIIDLEKTVPLFQEALNVIAHIAYRGGIILFISRQKFTMHKVELAAQNCGEYAHCRYWNPGLFTDSANVFGFAARLPDLCLFLNTQNSVFRTHRAVTDCAKLLIPTVGIVDSNCDPRLITYPIPANDDTFLTILHYLKLFETTIKIAKAKRKMDEENGTVLTQ